MGIMTSKFLREDNGLDEDRETYGKAILYCLGYDDGYMAHPPRSGQYMFEEYELGYQDGRGDSLELHLRQYP